MSSGGMSSALSTLDPLGSKITQWGGDPLNLYGNQNNPNAAFFPSGTAASPTPGVLPNLGAASMQPRLPQGAFQAPAAGGGQFNSMAAQLAGPFFNPAVRVEQPQPQASSGPSASRLTPVQIAMLLGSRGNGLIRSY